MKDGECMDKNVKKVRKAIEQRKKERGRMYSAEKVQPIYFEDTEEKHGYPPNITGHHVKQEAGNQGAGNREIAPFIMKGILSGILFFSIAILMHSDFELLEKPQQTAENLLKNEFPFAKVNVWYQEVFGSPLALSPQSAIKGNGENEGGLPVSGKISESFQVNGEGVKITPGKETDVFSHKDGVVVFAGNDTATNKTIIIQHEDGTNSKYGFLSEIEVYLYQYVNTNQRIGSFHPESGSESVYFSLEKDNSYLDPVQVIEVDDIP